METGSLFVELRPSGEQYSGLIHAGDRSRGLELGGMALGPKATVRLKGRDFTLGAVVRGLVTFDTPFLQEIFDERGQLELGQQLYERTIARLQRPPSTEGDIRVLIVTADEHIARLPWVLLAKGPSFLAMTGWSMAVTSEIDTGTTELPPNPSMLVVMPEPKGVPGTEAAKHVGELEEILSAGDRFFSRAHENSHLSVARTWDEFRAALAARRQHILYYYGHGEGDLDKTRLIFETGPDRVRRDVSIAEFASALRNGKDGPPTIAYLNCCYGDAGGVLGAGRQLGAFVPAVVSNRTVAYIAPAQDHALRFWSRLLLEGMSPHRSTADIFRNLGETGLDIKDPGWITPVLHTRYPRWVAHPPRRQSALGKRDAHWRYKLDRIRQISRITYGVRQMLRERKPAALGFIWYGMKGQGISLFHERLTVELQEDLASTEVYEVRPKWPDDMEQPHVSFLDMLCEVFELEDLEDLPARVRERTRGESGRTTLVYVRHEPLSSDSYIKPKHIRTYLEWWEQNVTPRIREARAAGLLGVSFVVRDPKRFRLVADKAMAQLDLRGIRSYLLEELGTLSIDDLKDFVETHSISLPPDRRDEILAQVLLDTRGEYEQTLEELKTLERRAWDLSAVAADSDGDEDDEDY